MKHKKVQLYPLFYMVAKRCFSLKGKNVDWGYLGTKFWGQILV